VVEHRGWKIKLRAAVVLLTFAGGMMISADPVRAQGLFDVLNRIFGGLFSPPPPAETKYSGGGPVTYYVRLCDGRYFPMAANAGAPHSYPDKICSAMCPASAAKIYTGSGIDQASAVDGTPYSKLENAFAYRERMVSDCTCTGKEIGGIVAIDIHSDPTLRRGDIVATRDGLMVFKGSKELPYQTSDFIPAEDYKDLSDGVRRTLAELRVTPEPERAIGDVATAKAATEPRLSTLVPQTNGRLSRRDTPVAEALTIFSFPIF
jgi:hypothetical protein